MRHSADQPYMPRAGSLPAQVVNFFMAAPDEQLTTPDIAAKFDADKASVANQLRSAVQTGLLAQQPGMGGSPSTFRAGPRLLAGEYPERAPADTSAQADQPATPPAPATRTAPPRRPAPAVQVHATTAPLPAPADDPAAQAIVIHVHVHLTPAGVPA